MALKESNGVWVVKKCSFKEVLTVKEKKENSEKSKISNKFIGPKNSIESDNFFLLNTTVENNSRHLPKNIMDDSKDDNPIRNYRTTKFLDTLEFKTQIIIVASIFGGVLLAINIITIICCKCKCCRCCYNF